MTQEQLDEIVAAILVSGMAANSKDNVPDIEFMIAGKDHALKLLRDRKGN